MYNNPIGPGAASAGLGGMALFADSPLLWALFAALALFTIVNALGALLFRVFPAELTERPRAALLRLVGRGAAGRATAPVYDFGGRGI